jgi:hypothetical protein
VELGWVDRLRHQRVPAVGSDHDTRVFNDGRAARTVPAYADDVIMFVNLGFDAEAFTHLDTPSTAASSGSLSSTVRRGPYATVPSGLGAPESVNGPKSKA